jgi:putative endonuclease
MINNDKRTEKRRLGDIGENIACEFLKKHGFGIIERNYLRKWGEIDIVARKGGVIRFVEVKTVTHGTLGYRPEDNMHPWKLKRLARTIQTYLLHPPERLFPARTTLSGWSRAGKKQEIDWQLDLITVKMDMNTHRARVELIENIVI